MIGHLGTRTSALLDGQLPAAEAERLWAHVHGCHLCRDLVEREGWVKTRLSGLGAPDRTQAPAHLKGASLHIVFMLIPMLHDKDRADHGAILAELAKLIDSGALKPVVDEPQFTLEEVGAAYDRLASGKAIGKVVVDV